MDAEQKGWEIAECIRRKKMFNLSFRRFGNGIYISHTDVLRSLNRIMRRAEIDVAYSKGFNKHMSLKLTQPLPLGIASDDEWVTVNVESKITKEEFFEKFKVNCPPFLEALEIYETEINPSLASKVTASKYFIKSISAYKYKTEIENLKNGCIMKVKKAGEFIDKDVTDYVYEVDVNENGIICTVAFGSKNLRMDSFCNYLNENYGLKIKLSEVLRLKQLIDDNGNMITVNEYIGRLK